MAVTKLSTSSISNFSRFNDFRATSVIPYAKISGGNSTVTSGGFKYHVFTGNGTLTIGSSGFVEVFIQAGGGGGGGNNGADQNAGGGGGAGGVRFEPLAFMDSGSATVVVGAGGSNTTSGNGGNGGNGSVQWTTKGQTVRITAYGGGGGGNQSNIGVSGGCSGGNGDDIGGTARPVPQLDSPFILGNSGGPSPGSGRGGGGGGTGAAATNSYGGNGTTLFSEWGIATSTGELSGGVRYYGGGGGGGGNQGSSIVATGGLGGGGRADFDGRNAVSATANTGGGGGATEQFGTSGSGGSGIVIVRVPV